MLGLGFMCFEIFTEMLLHLFSIYVFILLRAIVLFAQSLFDFFFKRGKMSTTIIILSGKR